MAAMLSCALMCAVLLVCWFPCAAFNSSLIACYCCCCRRSGDLYGGGNILLKAKNVFKGLQVCAACCMSCTQS
jgi:hypothetical protein